MYKMINHNLLFIALFLFVSMTVYAEKGDDSSSPVVTELSEACVGANCVPLGKAARYAILAKKGISTFPPSMVTGNIGLSPAARAGLTGWSLKTDPTDTSFSSAQVAEPGKLYAADNPGGTTSVDLTTAVLNMGTAYTNAAGRSVASDDFINVGGGNLSGYTLPSGTYEWDGDVSIPANLKLHGSSADIWIFKVGGTLTMSKAKKVVLRGGAQARNIFWQVAGAVTIGANAHFEGIVLGRKSISLGHLASINGRLLSQNSVALDSCTINVP